MVAKSVVAMEVVVVIVTTDLTVEARATVVEVSQVMAIVEGVRTAEAMARTLLPAMVVALSLLQQLPLLPNPLPRPSPLRPNNSNSTQPGQPTTRRTHRKILTLPMAVSQLSWQLTEAQELPLNPSSLSSSTRSTIKVRWPRLVPRCRTMQARHHLRRLLRTALLPRRLLALALVDTAVCHRRLVCDRVRGVTRYAYALRCCTVLETRRRTSKLFERNKLEQRLDVSSFCHYAGDFCCSLACFSILWLFDLPLSGNSNPLLHVLLAKFSADAYFPIRSMRWERLLVMSSTSRHNRSFQVVCIISWHPCKNPGLCGSPVTSLRISAASAARPFD
jgi:hypothetical protein